MRYPFSRRTDALQPADLQKLSDGCLRHRRDEYNRILLMFEPYHTREAVSLKSLLEDAIQSVNRELDRRLATADIGTHSEELLMAG